VPDIQTPTPSEKLRTTYKIRTPFGLFLAEDLIPVVLVDDLTGEVPADTGYPRGAVGRMVVAGGGAGTQAQAILAARPNRGLVWVVEKAIISAVAANVIIAELRTGQAVTGAPTERFTKTYRDLRATGAAGFEPNALMASNTPLSAAVIGQVVGRYTVLAQTSITIPLGITLGGDQFVNIVNDVADVPITVTFYWSEYLEEDR